LSRLFKSRPAGIDRFGKFYKMTGFEEVGYCFWCGLPIKKRRYCCEDHRLKYLQKFYLPESSYFVLRSQEYKCIDCGIEGSKRNPLEIHHIEQVNGEFRKWNRKNNPGELPTSKLVGFLFQRRANWRPLPPCKGVGGQ